jgi:hypothetical protein
LKIENNDVNSRIRQRIYIIDKKMITSKPFPTHSTKNKAFRNQIIYNTSNYISFVPQISNANAMDPIIEPSFLN